MKAGIYHIKDMTSPRIKEYADNNIPVDPEDYGYAFTLDLPELEDAPDPVEWVYNRLNSDSRPFKESTRSLSVGDIVLLFEDGGDKPLGQYIIYHTGYKRVTLETCSYRKP